MTNFTGRWESAPDGHGVWWVLRTKPGPESQRPAGIPPWEMANVIDRPALHRLESYGLGEVLAAFDAYQDAVWGYAAGLPPVPQDATIDYMASRQPMTNLSLLVANTNHCLDFAAALVVGGMVPFAEIWAIAEHSPLFCAKPGIMAVEKWGGPVMAEWSSQAREKMVELMPADLAAMAGK